jgi:hypothetical protein
MRVSRRAFQFFLRHAGYVVGKRAQGALRLARAEYALHTHDTAEAVWMPDMDCDDSWMTDEERAQSHTWETCAIVMPCDEHGISCRHSKYVVSVGGVVDADSDYRRVIEAELAAEALL